MAGARRRRRGCHVSTRRSDDPALYRRIVVSDVPDGRPTHLIHHPDGLDLWVKMTVGPYPLIEIFPTLTGALNSISVCSGEVA